MDSLWLEFFPKRDNARFRIFCFPYSGGSPTLFFKWGKILPVDFEVIGICLPGRGRRIYEAKYTKMKDLIPVLSKEILPLLVKDYFFYGHSLGGIIAYELIQELRSLGALLPLHLFVGGTPVPLFKSIPNPENLHRNKTPEQMKQTLREYGGTPEEVLNNQELMDLLLPMIQADFILGQEYVHERLEAQIPVPITNFTSLTDYLVSAKQDWGKHTSKSCKEVQVEGGHFFITTNTNSFLDLFSQELDKYK